MVERYARRPRPRSRRVASASVLTILIAAFAMPAHAVDVRGSVVADEAYANRRAPEANVPHYWREWNGVLAPLPNTVDYRRDVAIAILAASPPATPPGQFDVRLHGGAATPSTILVRPGTMIVFTNSDDFSHELSADGLQGLRAEPTAPAGRRSVRIAEAGSWALRDSAGPGSTGHIHALANLVAVAHPDREGRFTFPSLPAGHYTLKVFHGANEAGSQEIDVPGGNSEMVVPPIRLGAAESGATSPSRLLAMIDRLHRDPVAIKHRAFTRGTRDGSTDAAL